MIDTSEPTDGWDVVVVGDGPAGLTAATFTARHDLRTLVLGTGDSILRRNAHLENFPGFPAGVDARLLLDAMRDQADRAGATVRSGRVVELAQADDGSDAPGFVVGTADGDRVETRYVVAATKNETGYLAGLDVDLVDHGKTFVATDAHGRTSVPGLYAAGRLAAKPHQAVVAAGHGAEVAVTLLDDDGTPFYHDWVTPEASTFSMIFGASPFYHDWVTPEGYFTGRGREIPPGCEEIPEAEWRERAEDARATMQRYLDEPHSDSPEQHPRVVERDDGG